LAKPHLAQDDISNFCDSPYVHCELQHLADPSYDNKVALARALAAHDPQLAERVATEALAIAPERYEANICLAAIYERFEKYHKAREQYQLAVNKGCTDCSLQLLRAANRAGEWKVTIDTYRDMLSQGPEAQLEQARAIRALRGAEEGLKTYSSLPLDRLRPTLRADALTEMAVCALELGQHQRALELTRQLGQIDSLKATRVRGVALWRLGKWAEASQLLNKYVRIATADAEALVALAHCQLMLGDLRGARDNGQRAREVKARDQDAACITVQALVGLGEYEEAARVGNSHGFAGVPPGCVARLLVGLRQFQDAAEFIRSWLKNNSDEPDAYACMGWLSIRMNRLADALYHYEHALELSPENRWLQAEVDALRDALRNPELEAED